MTMEQFIDYKEKAFDSFSKTLIRNESADAFREIAAIAAKQVSLSALSYAEQAALCTPGEYIPCGQAFYVQGMTVTVNDWPLAQALKTLPPKRRDVILLSYFLGQSDPQIGKLLKLSAGTVYYRRTTALTRLRAAMEDIQYEQ